MEHIHICPMCGALVNIVCPPDCSEHDEYLCDDCFAIDREENPPIQREAAHA